MEKAYSSAWLAHEDKSVALLFVKFIIITLLTTSYSLSLPVLQPLSHQLSETAVLYLNSLSVFSGLECVSNLRGS